MDMNKRTVFRGKITNREALAASDGLIIDMEFVLCDDGPNDNKQGIPTEAFAHLIPTGQYMPVKMEEGRIGGHPFSKPIGAIKDLSEQGNSVVGHAAIWAKERPDDVALIREAFASGSLNVSFEVLYTDFSVDDSGVEWLLDPALRAATIVSVPAYSGRTPVTSLAEKQLIELPDSSFAWIEPGGQVKNGTTHPRSLRHFPYKDAEGNVDENLLKESLAALEEVELLQKDAVRALLLEAQAALEEEKKQTMDKERLEQLEAESATLKSQLEDIQKELDALKTERDELQEWKEAREQRDAEAEVLKSRLALLADAGFEYEAEAIESKRKLWLSLDDEAFATYVEDLKSVREAKASSDGDSDGVPDLSGGGSGTSPMDTIKEHFGKKEE